MTKVPLDKYRTKGCKVFSGDARGRIVAEHILETYGEEVEIIIPDDVCSISHTFSRSFNEILPDKLDWKSELNRRINEYERNRSRI